MIRVSIQSTSSAPGSPGWVPQATTVQNLVVQEGQAMSTKFILAKDTFELLVDATDAIERPDKVVASLPGVRVAQGKPTPKVAVKGRSPADVYKGDIADAEVRSRKLWAEMDVDDQAAVLAVLRETLLRLLEKPDWVPGALAEARPAVNGLCQQVAVTITLEMSEADKALERANWQRDQGLMGGLMALRDRLRGQT